MTGSSPSWIEAARKVLDRRFSYRVDGAHFAAAYQRGGWDGRVRLLKGDRRGGLLLPWGVADEAAALLRKHWPDDSVTITDRGPGRPVLPRRACWSGPVLRGYQRDAVLAALDAWGARTGGILNLPIRAGKTMIAGAVIAEVGERALFVVTSDMLLQQAVGALTGALSGLRVTAWGGGARDGSGDVVVATIQTLAKDVATKRMDMIGAAAGWGLVVYDEVHHVQGDGGTWRDVALRVHAPCKLGLSATIETDRKRQMDTAAIWLRAACGPVLYSVGMSDLIERGYLLRPTVHWLRHNADPLPGAKWSPAVYKDGIDECWPRNLRIAEAVLAEVQRGSRVLVDVARIRHAQALTDLCVRMIGTDRVVMLIGTDDAARRAQVLTDFRAGAIQVIVGTLLGEGVDVPELDVVVNAEGGKAKTSTIQRLRNLTTAPGKTRAVVYEVADKHHPTLQKWALERLLVYRGEPAFKIVVEGPPR